MEHEQRAEPAGLQRCDRDGQRLRIGDPVDHVEQRLHRLDPGLLDRGLVDARAIERAELLEHRIIAGLRARRVEDAVLVLEVLVGDRDEAAHRERLVGGDLGLRDPVAARELIEVFARVGGAIDRVRIEADRGERLVRDRFARRRRRFVDDGLGLLIHDRRGCRLGHRRSRSWFSRSARSGDDDKHHSISHERCRTT